MKLRRKLIFLSIAIFISFIIFSYFIWQNPFWSFDKISTLWLQNTLPRFLDLPLSFVSILGAPELTVLLISFLGLYYFFKKKYLICLGLTAIIPATLIEIFTKSFLYHPGPVGLSRNELNFFLPSNLIQTDFGYPTGRVLRTTFLLVFLLALSMNTAQNKYHRRAFQTILIGFFCLMLVSRIYLGEHWFSDVLGAVMLGSSFGLLAATTILINKNKTKDLDLA